MENDLIAALKALGWSDELVGAYAGSKVGESITDLPLASFEARIQHYNDSTAMTFHAVGSGFIITKRDSEQFTT